jgi:nanoRNase/pAp phosphatase (c-di-AMP/oligoRNAs hydrolase)
MSEAERWNDHGRMLWREKDGLRLVIHLPPTTGYVRVLVIDHHGLKYPSDRLIASGTFEDVRNAKDAAERMAVRLVKVQRR